MLGSLAYEMSEIERTGDPIGRMMGESATESKQIRAAFFRRTEVLGMPIRTIGGYGVCYIKGKGKSARIVSSRPIYGSTGEHDLRLEVGTFLDLHVSRSDLCPLTSNEVQAIEAALR